MSEFNTPLWHPLAANPASIYVFSTFTTISYNPGINLSIAYIVICPVCEGSANQ